MPYTTARMTRPLPRPAPPGPVRRIQAPRPQRATGSTLAQILGGWAFTARVYIAFDGPNAAMPNWLDVTPFVEADTITINHGRPDGISDVQVSTCTLTVNNMDGRWTPTYAGGAWAGLMRKGIWLAVEVIPLSGIVSRRYTGFITDLPTGWAGLYASTEISASDRFLLLGQAPLLPPTTSAEVLYDSSTGPVVAAHYTLAEQQVGNGAALAFGDTSGNLSAPLVPTPWGTATSANYLACIKAQGASAPGFDGGSCVQFQPSAITQGAVLSTTVADWSNYDPGGNDYGVLEFWCQTTFVNTIQPIASMWDRTAGVALIIAIDATGYLLVGSVATTAASTYSTTAYGVMSPGSVINGAAVQAGVVLNDGNWHYVSVAVNLTQFGPSVPILVINIDGKTVWIGFGTSNVSPYMDTLTIGGSIAGAGAPECFTGNIAGVSWILTGSRASNYPAHYAAGYQGFFGESVDQRIARVARYLGISQPTTLQVPAAGYNPVPVYAAGKYGPWTNLGACVHLVGTQSIAGRQGLDVMREAARTEQMPLYIDRSGYLTIQPCTVRDNAQVAWSLDALDLDPSTKPQDDYTYLKNQISVTPNGGPTQVVNGPAGLASQAQYGVYNDSLQTASINATEAANAALSVIGHNADPVPRLPFVLEVATLAVKNGAAWYDQVLASEISTLVQVYNLPAQAPAPAMNLFLEGWTETIGAGTHTFAFNTSPQTDASVLQLDTPGSTLDTPGITLAY